MDWVFSGIFPATELADRVITATESAQFSACATPTPGAELPNPHPEQTCLRLEQPGLDR